MRLIFDTNVLISAILATNSLPAQVLDWGELNGIILYSSDTFTELFSVLSRSKFAKYIDANDIEGLSMRIKATWVFVPILQQVKLCRDAKDDKFIELALNGDASYLISGDDDLLVLEKIQDVSIVNPRTFWDDITNH
jgi:putative PIN family toxin of toxin-antitoxin system